MLLGLIPSAEFLHDFCCSRDGWALKGTMELNHQACMVEYLEQQREFGFVHSHGGTVVPLNQPIVAIIDRETQSVSSIGKPPVLEVK